ncbi:MAG: hypothetical protein C5B50_05265 [Verrucomicrobia bacterium]|nr:MAG: hypothetical protein C5B50_05265 [Verrucomicrobiota bacterium]
MKQDQTEAGVASMGGPEGSPRTSGPFTSCAGASPLTEKHIPSASRLSRVAFNVKETAAMLGICEKSVRRLVARGLLRPSRALRHLLIPKNEIERFLKETVSS